MYNETSLTLGSSSSHSQIALLNSGIRGFPDPRRLNNSQRPQGTTPLGSMYKKVLCGSVVCTQSLTCAETIPVRAIASQDAGSYRLVWTGSIYRHVTSLFMPSIRSTWKRGLTLSHSCCSRKRGRSHRAAAQDARVRDDGAHHHSVHYTRHHAVLRRLLQLLQCDSAAGQWRFAALQGQRPHRTYLSKSSSCVHQQANGRT